MYKLVMLLIIGGAALAWHGYKEYRLNGSMTPEAAPVRCADLESGGPPEGNAHVRVSDVMICPVGFVGQRENDHSPWSTVWLPAVSRNSAYADQIRTAWQVYGVSGTNLPKPKNLLLIVKTRHCQTQDQIEALAGKSVIEGVIVNSIESLTSKETAILAKQYPGVDFSQCWILEEGREPTSSGAAMGFMGGGVLMFVGGFFLVAKH